MGQGDSRARAERSRDDHALVDDYLEGDLKAFAEIVQRHKKRLHYVARSYVCEPTDAEDVVQEALLKASQSLHTYRAEAQLATWLTKLVRNVGYDWLNHRANAMHETIDHVHDQAANPQLSHAPHKNLDIAMDVNNALTALSPEFAQALLLTVVGGYSIKELATELQVAPGTIKSRTARAKTLLKDVIQH